MKIIYRIYVEGSHVETTTSFKKAMKLKRIYENEGWYSVRLIKFKETLI